MSLLVSNGKEGEELALNRFALSHGLLRRTAREGLIGPVQSAIVPALHDGGIIQGVVVSIGGCSMCKTCAAHAKKQEPKKEPEKKGAKK